METTILGSFEDRKRMSGAGALVLALAILFRDDLLLFFVEEILELLLDTLVLLFPPLLLTLIRNILFTGILLLSFPFAFEGGDLLLAFWGLLVYLEMIVFSGIRAFE